MVWVHWKKLLKSKLFCDLIFFLSLWIFSNNTCIYQKFFNIQQKNKRAPLKPPCVVFFITFSNKVVWTWYLRSTWCILWIHQIIWKIWKYWSTTTEVVVLPQKLLGNVYNTFFTERKEVWEKKFRRTSRT